MVIDAEYEHADLTGTSSPSALSPYRASLAFSSCQSSKFKETIAERCISTKQHQVNEKYYLSSKANCMNGLIQLNVGYLLQ